MDKPRGRKSEIRRLQLTGGSTYIVSLPKRWVKEHGLVAKDQIRVEWRPSGNLRIIPETSMISRRREVELTFHEIPPGLIIDHLIAAYLSGASIIRIRSKSGFDSKDKKLLRRFISLGRGIEIVNETEKMIEIESLANAGSLPIYSSLNRMYLLVRTALKDVFEAVSTGDISFIEDIEERENEVDALRLLIERQIGQVLESAYLEDSAGLSRWEASALGNIVRTFERMGDHVYTLGQLVVNRNDQTNVDVNALPFSLIPSWLMALKQLNSNIKKPNLSEVHEAKLQLTHDMATLSEFEEAMWKQSDTVNAIYMNRSSESIRRLCAYASDMAEIVLNIHVHKNSNIVVFE